jgi:aryl-alcohol dehydrogenase-like predicted oxidoreductase
MSKELALGTALYGWGIEKTVAFNLLDIFYKNGFRFIDSAYNYPINSQPKSLNASMNILSEWIAAHQIRDMKIIYKAGSILNENTPENNLTIPNLKNNIELSINKFGSSNIESFMIHWDNQEDTYSKHHFKDIFSLLKQYNIHFGLSGISYPKIYQNSLSDINMLYTQGKHNIFFSDISKYDCLVVPNKRFFSYGISVSGLKLNKEDYTKHSYVSLARQPSFHDNIMTEKNKQKLIRFFDKYPYAKSMYHTGIILNEKNKNVFGYMVAPRSIEQLNEILSFRQKAYEINV